MINNRLIFWTLALWILTNCQGINENKKIASEEQIREDSIFHYNKIPYNSIFTINEIHYQNIKDYTLIGADTLFFEKDFQYADYHNHKYYLASLLGEKTDCFFIRKIYTVKLKSNLYLCIYIKPCYAFQSNSFYDNTRFLLFQVLDGKLLNIPLPQDYHKDVPTSDHYINDFNGDGILDYAPIDYTQEKVLFYTLSKSNTFVKKDSTYISLCYKKKDNYYFLYFDTLNTKWFDITR